MVCKKWHFLVVVAVCSVIMPSAQFCMSDAGSVCGYESESTALEWSDEDSDSGDSMGRSTNISEISDDAEYEERAMLRAVLRGEANEVDDLLMHGVSADAVARDGTPLLIVALRRGYRDVADRLVNVSEEYAEPANPDTPEPAGRGMWPLHVAMACARCDEDVIFAEQLVTPFVLDRHDGMGFAPLHYAALLGESSEKRDLSVKAAAMLLRYRMQRDVCNAEGQTPLMLAAHSGNLPLVKFLANHPKKKGDRLRALQAEDVDGCTARHLAELQQHDNVVAFLDEVACACAKRATRSCATGNPAKRVRRDYVQQGQGTLDGWLGLRQ